MGFKFIKDFRVGPNPPAPASNAQLREDGSYQLREDGGKKVRE